MTVRPVSAKLRILWAMLAILWHAETSKSSQDGVRTSVVKIYATQRSPDLVRPWTKSAPKELSGTGFVIEGNRILTNAHVVRHAATIYVQPYQSAEKLSAKVESIASPVDLAVLTIEDEEFFKERPALIFDEELPSVKSRVTVYGYPVGGDELSITEGIISRVEYTRYFYDAWGLRIQIDAALNPGNSGGPAISEGKLVGVSFSGLNNAENIGYLIPIVEVQMFLDDIKDGTYDGKPHLWDVWQTTENDALREWLKMPKDLGGCMVFGNARNSASPLKVGDVITKVGPHSLDRSGNVKLGNDLQVQFNYFVPTLAKDGVVPLTLHRDGQSVEALVPVHPQKPRLFRYLENGYPRYFILGPLVFSPASAELVQGLGSEVRLLRPLVRQSNPLLLRANDAPAFEGEELVVIPSPYFSHRLTKGYSQGTFQIVTKLNGEPVKSLAHLVELVRDAKSKYLEFEFAGTEMETLVFPRQELLDSTDEILSDNGIRKQCSDELEAIWNM